MTWSIGLLAGVVTVYAIRWGIETPSSSKALRWVGLGSASRSKLTSAPGTAQVLRVSVAR